MFNFSKFEKYNVLNTLNCIPVLLEGQSVLIDMRNETSVAGRIINADGHMNIHLDTAVYIDRDNQHYPFDEFMVRERMIMQIHVPGDFNLQEAMQSRLFAQRRRPTVRRDGGKRTFKQKRAEEKHKETLREIYKQKQQKQQSENEKAPEDTTK